jgi:hypothetical protein
VNLPVWRRPSVRVWLEEALIMSTTVTISPSDAGEGVILLAAATVAAAGFLLSAVLTDDAECKQMLEQARREQRAQRFGLLTLRTSDLGRLAQSAREAQFTVRENSNYIRIDVPGQRDPVWAVRTAHGIAIAGGADSGARVSVANTVSRLTQTLAARGSTLARVPSRQGRRGVEFAAPTANNRQLKIAVTPSGEAVVDAVNHHGPECDQAARDLAAAMDGRITSFSRKPEFFGGGGVLIGSKQGA